MKRSVPHPVVRKYYSQGEMVFQRPAVIAVALAEVDRGKPKVGIGIEERVVKEFNSDVDNVQVHLPILNSKQRQLVVKAQL